MADLIEKARNYAINAHARINQLRKYTQLPYDVHLKAVADLVASVCADQAVIAAAWLHDTVEDTPATFEDIEREFGSDVMQLVKDLTDVSRPGDGNRAVRKALDRQHSAGASSRAKTIKLADIIDNCEDICRHDADFGRVYLGEAKALLEVLAEGDQSLYARASRLLAASGDRLGLSAPESGREQQPPEVWNSRQAQAGRHGLRLFMEAFAARDIQEPLLSFDRATVAAISPGEWPWENCALAGVRENGVITGYLSRDDLETAHPLRVRALDHGQLVALDASLTDVIHVLTHFTYCFVHLNGAVVGVISKADIEKPVVRMWLFGIIIMAEVQLVALIRSRWPDNRWIEFVSEGRMEKARQLQTERSRRGFAAELLDCLQFSDKFQIVVQDPAFVEAAGFGSVSAAKKVIRDLESLRNNLAHGQDVTRHDWPQIVRLARRLQQLYAP